MKKLINHNCPEALLEVAQKWAEKDMRFYLGPENMFLYNNFPISYSYCPEISRKIGDWYVCSEDCNLPMKLTKEQADDIQHEFYKGKFPDFAIMAIGYTCNINCHMCIYHGEGEEFYKQKFKKQCIEVDTETVKKRLDKIKELGISKVFIGTNGEIFIRKDWEELFQYAKDLGFQFIFTTNATVITDKVLEKLKQFKDVILSIKVSINAFHLETYQKVNGTKNDKLYYNAMSAVEKLHKMGINVMPSFVVTEVNKEDIKDFVQYWTKKGIGQNLANKLEIEEFVYGRKEINNTSWPYYSCKSINNMFLVEPTGDIGNCCRTVYAFDDEDSFNVYKMHIDEDAETIKNKWFQGLEEKVYQKFCATCPLYELNSNANQLVTKIFDCDCSITDLGVVVTPNLKKSLGTKIKNEMRRFVKRINKK